MKLDYRKLKDEWKQKGEIPDWYSTNALQFFMDKYSYQGETVRSRDTAVAKYLAKHAPNVYPDWWEEDEYTQGKTYEQIWKDKVFKAEYEKNITAGSVHYNTWQEQKRKQQLEEETEKI